jgi:hypothetical protein
LLMKLHSVPLNHESLKAPCPLIIFRRVFLVFYEGSIIILVFSSRRVILLVIYTFILIKIVMVCLALLVVLHGACLFI